MTIKKTKPAYSFGDTPESIVDGLSLFVLDAHDDISQLAANIVTTLPTADKEKRGSFMILESAATDDKLYFCILNAADGYEWKLITFT